jgi:hypothetical protein
MRHRRNLPLAGILLGLVLLPGAALAEGPGECGSTAKQPPARTAVRLELQVPALGIDWKGTMSVMHHGAVPGAADPQAHAAGSHAGHLAPGPDPEAPSLVDLAWEAMKFLQAVSRIPAGLARYGLRQLF